MVIYNIFVVSKSGGLIFDYGHDSPPRSIEKTFSYPLDIKLKYDPNQVTVVFGEHDGICPGQSLVSVNGVALTNGRLLSDGREVMQVIDNENNYPLVLKFTRPRLTTNEKIVLASMFYPLHAMSVQLSPCVSSSGIQELESDTFKLYCSQTITGLKFIVVCDAKQTGIDSLMAKMYELYADYALKNPFYSLEMPIRADLFDKHLQIAVDQIERTGFI